MDRFEGNELKAHGSGQNARDGMALDSCTSGDNSTSLTSAMPWQRTLES
jgi:hypothetical protein